MEYGGFAYHSRAVATAPKKSSSQQLTVVRKLLKEATQIIHAGDPDREGQLLVDEVIDYCKVPKSKKKPCSAF